jgi:hypothetical protein
VSKFKKLKKQVREQDDIVYGEETISGSSPKPESDDDIEEILEEVMGDDIDFLNGFSLEEEVKKDEKARRTKKNLDIEKIHFTSD